MAGVVEGALTRLLHEPIKIVGAGRTDSGVHASGQVISFATGSRFPIERLALALNGCLPPDCSVRDAAGVDDDFSARFSAIERTYEYGIVNAPQRWALGARYACHVARSLQLNAMREAGAQLLGEHDFRAFAGSGDGASSVRIVRHFAVESAGELVRIQIVADGFLHRMVRTIVGTLLECAAGRRAADLSAIIASRDRTAAGVTAPARGLCLAGVRYGDGYDSYRPHPLWRTRSLEA